MKRKVYVVIAGVQPAILDRLAAPLRKTRPDVFLPLRGLPYPERYTDDYVSKLYERVACELRQHQPAQRENLLTNANLIVLYAEESDGSDSRLLHGFGLEALLLPLHVKSMGSMRMVTSNQRNRIMNMWIKEINRALRQTRGLLHVIAEEVTNRDNRTCLLLPPKTFGNAFSDIRERIRQAVRNREGEDKFRKSLKYVSSLLRKRERKHFIGQGRLVFKCPGKSSRHGLAPSWGDGTHDSSCVIRGRLRFGVSFDPRFHYDCEIPRRNMTFPGCHESQSIPAGRLHVNVAPNDNVR